MFQVSKFKKVFNHKVIFIFEFLLVASLLFFIFYFGEKSYISFIRQSMSAYYYFFKNIFGLKPPQHIYADLLLIQALSFFALTFVTPKIPFKRKIKFLLIGIAIFFAADFFFTILNLSFQASEVWILLVADFLKLALPISLWFIFSYNYLIKFVEERIEK